MVIDLTDNLKSAAIKITNFTYVGEALRVADRCQQPLQRFHIEQGKKKSTLTKAVF